MATGEPLDTYTKLKEAAEKEWRNSEVTIGSAINDDRFLDCTNCSARPVFDRNSVAHTLHIRCPQGHYGAFFNYGQVNYEAEWVYNKARALWNAVCLTAGHQDDSVLPKKTVGGFTIE